MSVQHRTGVDYRHSTAAKNRCDVRENDGRVTVDITHREASGCARCGCVRFVTRNVMDDQLRMSSATCCALCGAVDQLLIVPEVPLVLPVVGQSPIFDELSDEPVDFWPAVPVAVQS